MAKNGAITSAVTAGDQRQNFQATMNSRQEVMTMSPVTAMP